MLLKLVEKRHVQIQEIHKKRTPKFCAHLIVIKNVQGVYHNHLTLLSQPQLQPRDQPSPSSFPGSSSGTTVTLGRGSYQVTETGVADNYNPTYSSACSGSISAGQTKTCTVTNTFTPPTGTLTVIVLVEGGTAQPSDFNIVIALANNPSPSQFQGSSSGTTVTLGEGNFRVEERWSCL